MPVEIRELHIRVSVSPPSTGLPAGAPTPAGAGDAAPDEALVAECVDQVLQVLHDRQER